MVVGAGILGAAVAARLAEGGLRVTLLDQDEPGRATSRWSFAWINSNDKAPRPYHDLNHAGMRAWAELAPDLDGDAWYRPSGHVELATAGTGELEARVRRLTEWGYPARLVSPAEAAELEPALRLPAPAAAFFPDEGYLLTEPLIARLVARAESHGAQVLTGEPARVTSIDTSGHAPPRVRTAAGAVLEADEVICCAGRWTPSLAAVPLVPWQRSGSTAPGLVVRVGPVAPPGPVRLLHTPDLAVRPHPGGLLHLEAEDAAAAVDLHTPEPELRRWGAELLRRARRTVRGLDDARVVRLPGLRPPAAPRRPVHRGPPPRRSGHLRRGDPQRRDPGRPPVPPHRRRPDHRNPTRRAISLHPRPLHPDAPRTRSTNQ